MNIVIKNNFLEKDLIDYLFNHFKQLPHYYGHRSSDKDKGNSFYSTNLNVHDFLYNFLCSKIAKIFKYDIKILRMYINIQHCFMDGEFHQDDGELTVLLMITPTLQSKSGCLEIKEHNKILKTIPFIQNKLVIFPASWYHKGCAPIEKNIPRITLVFKTERI